MKCASFCLLFSMLITLLGRSSLRFTSVSGCQAIDLKDRNDSLEIGMPMIIHCFTPSLPLSQFYLSCIIYLRSERIWILGQSVTMATSSHLPRFTFCSMSSGT